GESRRSVRVQIERPCDDSQERIGAGSHRTGSYRGGESVAVEQFAWLAATVARAVADEFEPADFGWRQLYGSGRRSLCGRGAYGSDQAGREAFSFVCGGSWRARGCEKREPAATRDASAHMGRRDEHDARDAAEHDVHGA